MQTIVWMLSDVGQISQSMRGEVIWPILHSLHQDHGEGSGHNIISCLLQMLGILIIGIWLQGHCFCHISCPCWEAWAWTPIEVSPYDTWRVWYLMEALYFSDRSRGIASLLLNLDFLLILEETLWFNWATYKPLKSKMIWFRLLIAFLRPNCCLNLNQNYYLVIFGS